VTDYLTLKDLLEIAEGIVPGAQVRDVGLLASAAARPQLSVFGEDAYPTLVGKAAALMHSIGRNHAWSVATSHWPGRPPASSCC
jgi:death-on-curing protein